MMNGSVKKFQFINNNYWSTVNSKAQNERISLKVRQLWLFMEKIAKFSEYLSGHARLVRDKQANALMNKVLL